ncbi:MAG: hypothetical protein PSX36_07715 [bacterium]|nr:hypothetical protein [bacterium]
MSWGELIGTLGVSILLLAFALNLANKLDTDSRTYLLLNSVGAALAGISSYLISFWPFVVLEGVWTISSLLMYLRTFRRA